MNRTIYMREYMRAHPQKKRPEYQREYMRKYRADPKNKMRIDCLSEKARWESNLYYYRNKKKILTRCAKQRAKLSRYAKDWRRAASSDLTWRSEFNAYHRMYRRYGAMKNWKDSRHSIPKIKNAIHNLKKEVSRV